jgi:hypothetical protein
VSAAKTQVVQIQANNLVWEAAPDPKTGVWIGVCRALNLNAVGDTWAEMQESANEAMVLLFTDLFTEGELPAFLRQNGWQQLGLLERGKAPQFDIPAEWQKRARFDQLVAHA